MSAVTQLYSALESMEVSVGGGGGFEGFYGSITAGGLSRVYESMGLHCNFGRDSFLVDIGGGLGRPLMHAVVAPGVASAIGIEVDEIKCLKSESVIHAAYKRMLQLEAQMQSVPLVLHKNVEQVNKVGTLDPATHAYSFWEGVPSKARVAFGELFAKSSTLQCIAIVQRAVRKTSPEEFMAGYHFPPLELVDTLKGVHMSGSQRAFTAYVFKRAADAGPPFRGPSELLLSSYLDAPRLQQTTLPRMLRSGSSSLSNSQASAATAVTTPRRRGRRAPGTAAAVETPTSKLDENAPPAQLPSSEAREPRCKGGDALPNLPPARSKRAPLRSVPATAAPAAARAQLDAHALVPPQDSARVKAQLEAPASESRTSTRAHSPAPAAATPGAAECQVTDRVSGMGDAAVETGGTAGSGRPADVAGTTVDTHKSSQGSKTQTRLTGRAVRGARVKGRPMGTPAGAPGTVELSPSKRASSGHSTRLVARRSCGGVD